MPPRPRVSLAELRTTPSNPWFSWPYVRHNIDTLTDALQQHASLTYRGGGVAALVAIPLAVVAYGSAGSPGRSSPVTGVLYTIPSLALFALLAPILGLPVRHRADRRWCCTRCW